MGHAFRLHVTDDNSGIQERCGRPRGLLVCGINIYADVVRMMNRRLVALAYQYGTVPRYGVPFSYRSQLSPV